MNSRLLLFLGVSFLFSCRKEEIPIEPYPRADVQSNTAALGTNYAFQLYFDLESNAFVAQNLKTDWDLGFSCATGDRRIRLNSSKLMSVWITGTHDFFSVTDTLGAVWKYDHSNGHPDSTAIGIWQDSTVLVIDRGYNASGGHLGFVKMQCLTLSGNEFYFRYAALNGSIANKYCISKDAQFNQKYFSFTGGNVVNIEPPKEDWDLLFTQYTHIYEDGDHYLVTGVLTNPYQTIVAKDTISDFQNVQLAQVQNLSFSTSTNSIGFDWKWYDFDSGNYLVYPELCYFILSSDNRYFKLHFLDFYNALGEKGYPLFEYKEL